MVNERKTLKYVHSREERELVGMNGLAGSVRIPSAEIDVPYRDCNHKDETLTFSHPLVGPAHSYWNLSTFGIDSLGLLRPTTAQTLSLLNLALENQRDPVCEDVLAKYVSSGFWTSTQTLPTSEGVIVYDNIDGKMPYKEQKLMNLFDAGDKRVRFVREDFDRSSHVSFQEFLEHPYAVAQMGENMDGVVASVVKGLEDRASRRDHHHDRSLKPIIVSSLQRRTKADDCEYMVRNTLLCGAGEGKSPVFELCGDLRGDGIGHGRAGYAAGLLG